MASEPTGAGGVAVTGSWDTHVHAGPDAVPRKVDVVELVEAAEEAEMGGLVLKNHHFPTAMLATVADECSDSELSVRGTVVLNRSLGGLNVDAVQAAASFGVKRVELPTMTAMHNMVEQHEPKTIELLADGGLSEPCQSVLDAAVENEMVVGTGHVSVDEVEAVIEYVSERGGNVLVTHPELHIARDGIGMTPDRQAELARDGVFFERCLVATNPVLGEHLRASAPPEATAAFEGDTIWEHLLDGIEATGPEHTVLATDLGQPPNQSPTDGLAEFHSRLLDAGYSRSELEQMARDNASQLFE